MEKGLGARAKVLKVLVVFVFVAIIARLFDVQILKHDEYVAKAKEQHIAENTIPAERGEIYMMDGEEPVKVAMNETVYTVTVDPLIVNEEKVREVIEKNAGEKIVAKWEDVFRDKTRRYYIVARNVSYAEAKKIEQEGLAGVAFEKTTKRVYPEGKMASRLLGFVNLDGVGQYGVEGAFNEKLAGVNGSRKAVRDVNGIALSIGDENVETAAVDGEDVYLTIDRNIQAKVDQILEERVANTKATNASAVVIDPANGHILAIGNAPNYDPAQYGLVEDATAYIDYALEEAYEPASVCKVFTYATGLDLGVIEPEMSYVNTYQMWVDGQWFQNAYTGFQGETITFQKALTYSLNVGSATVLKKISGGEEINEIGREKLYEYLMKFGLGKKTGVELAEATGSVPTPNEYDYTMNFTYANMTFGQGMNLTMLQVAAAYAGIVYGGEYHQPTVVYKEGEETTEGRRVISEEASAKMRGMLQTARGWQQLDPAGYAVGGKTGTGQVLLQQEDGTWAYSDSLSWTTATYAGFGGTEGELPRYVIVVKAWAEEGGYFTGEDDARPIFDQISNYLIDYLKIKPKQ